METSLSLKLEALQQLSYQVLHPEENSDYYYQDVWQETHSKISGYTRDLLQVKGKNEEEEAAICLALLIASGISPCLSGQKIQQVLDRASSVLSIQSSYPLKSQLQEEVNHLTG